MNSDLIVNSVNTLKTLGYEKPPTEQELSTLLNDASRLPELSNIFSWLSSEICYFWNLDEKVNAIDSLDDAEHLYLELSGLLRACGCAYTVLSSGSSQERFKNSSNLLLALNYLCKEYQACKLVATISPKALNKSQGSSATSCLDGSEVAGGMKDMCMALGFSRPPPELSPAQVFTKVCQQIKQLIDKHGKKIIDEPLLKAQLSQKQWKNLMALNDELLKEYRCRREMVLKRLDVTIQSFLWSDSAKRNEDRVYAGFREIRSRLSSTCFVSASDILAARTDLLRVDKITDRKSRLETQCAINKVMMGVVPDRGGRAYELEPPPPEMPAFQKRDGTGDRGRGRGGGGGDRGRVQGSWSAGGRGRSGGGADRGGWSGGRQGQYQDANFVPSFQPSGYGDYGFNQGRGQHQPSQGYQYQDQYTMYGGQSQQSNYYNQSYAPRGSGNRGRRGGYY